MVTLEEKICRVCEKTKSLDDFGRFTNNGKEGIRKICRACQYIQQDEWAEKRKEDFNHGLNGYVTFKCRCEICKTERAEYIKIQWDERADIVARIKLERGCADCGYDEYSCVLDFDHRPEEKKEFLISQMKQLNLESLLIEISKCDVVCTNCHRIRTAIRAGQKLRTKESVGL